MAVSKDEILETIAQMSVMDIVELIDLMENKFKVSASSVVTAAPIDGVKSSADSVKEEQTEFSLILSSFGDKKVGVIKAVRNITGLGLKDAKNLVESAPVLLKENLSKEDADKFKKQLEENGATIDIK